MPQTIRDRYEQLDPAELTTDQLLMWGLTTEVVGLRKDVLRERRGRRLSVVLIAVALFLGALVAYDINADQQREERTRIAAAEAACEIRKETSDRIRGAIEAAVDEAAIALGADDHERLLIGAAVATRVEAEYPPPRC
jgi:sirohydrochlorin ferrochelatase